MTRVLPPPALPNAPGELRQDPLGGGWVAITAGRAARPEAFLADVGTRGARSAVRSARATST